jgi:hypothetical protein
MAPTLAESRRQLEAKNCGNWVTGEKALQCRNILDSNGFQTLLAFGPNSGMVWSQIGR